MEVKIFFKEKMLPFVNVEILQNGILNRKKISIEQLLDIMNNVTTDNYLLTNELPSNYINGYLANNCSGKIAVFVEEQIQRFSFENQADAVMIPYPNLIFFFYIEKGILKSSRVFAVKEKKKRHITENTLLYHYPFGNVYSSDGSICWGRNLLRKIKNFREVEEFIHIFITSPTNTDLYIPGTTINRNINLLDFVKSIKGKKTFNYDCLTSSNLKFMETLKILKGDHNSI